MNKITVLIIASLTVFAVNGCKSFRTYFNPPPKKQNYEAELIQARRTANLTPHQKRQRQLKQNTFSLDPKKKAFKSNIDTSLNGYEQQYLNNYYQEQNSAKKKRNVFKLF